MQAVGIRLLGAGAAILLASVGWPGRSAGGSEMQAFNAQASADAGRVLWAAPGFLIVSEFIDGGFSTAQSVLTSSGVSESFASSPYPGPTALAVPGLIAGFGGPSLPAQYPLYVRADRTNPKARFSDPSGSFELSAEAADRVTHSRSASRAGLPSAQVAESISDTKVEAKPDGSVVAKATSHLSGLRVGEVLSVAEVGSASQTIAPADGGPSVTTGTLVVKGAAVGGTPVEITRDGIKVGGSGTGNPLAPVIAPVDQQLAAAGISARLVDGTTTPGGATGRALEIRFDAPSLSPAIPRTVYRLQIGVVSTSILNIADAPASGTLELPSDLTSSPGAVPTLESQSTAETTGSATVAAPAGAVTPVPSAPAAGSPAQAVNAPAAVAAGLPAESRIVARQVPLDFRSTGRLLFLPLALAGVCIAAGSVIWRLKGVRSR